MAQLAGVSIAVKKNHEVYYRSGITFHNKHISLGSFLTEEEAHKAYLTAQAILYTDDYTLEHPAADSLLSFDKQVSLMNYRDNGFYFGNPIYLYKQYFEYYLGSDICLKFDIDDLFYYGSHKIIKRGGHLCVADYGSQVSIHTRYGLKPYAVCGRDYISLSDDPYDYRRHNIQILNRYHGVSRTQKGNHTLYRAVIHIRGNYIIGDYETEDEAAIAYNKAIDILHKKGVKKNFTPNYLDGLSPAVYAQIYTTVTISHKIVQYSC